jgi:hypothetical protein
MVKVFPLLALMLLVACATPQTAVNPAAYGTTGARMVSDSAATLQSATAAAYSQQVEATRIAGAATAEAQEIANATMGAMMVTSVAQDVRQRDIELSGTATAMAAASSAQATATAIALLREQLDVQNEAALVAQESAARATAQARELERLQLENDMRRFWNGALPWIVAVAMFVLAGAAGGAVYIRFMDARRPAVYSMPVQRDSVPMIKGPNGWIALPARTVTQPEEVAEDGVYSDTTPAKWSAFTRWQHPSQLPLGATIDGVRQPLLIDRNQQPHILIAGKSGAGKTRSGMLPYILGMWASGAHVVVINGAGSDFRALQGVPNITFFQQGDERDLIRPLSEFLDATVREVQRRDQVLAQFGAATWRDLPAGINERSEILIAIDEFLAIILSAGELRKAIMASPQYNSAAERRAAADEVTHMVYTMWAAANKLASKSRKHGIHLLLSLTDPTKDLLGAEGMALRRQSLAVAFRMGTGAGSRAFLDTSHGEYPAGSVGLPAGQFLVNVDGQISRCVSFFPSDQDITQFIQARAPGVSVNHLPTSLQLGDGAVTGQWSDIAPTAHLPAESTNPVERDAELLRGRIRDCRSITAVGRILGLTRGDLSVGVNPSTKQIEDARAALNWLAERGDTEARNVLDIIS